MPTINTGTTAPTTVLIEGNEANANGQQIFVYEQEGAGAPTPANSLLLGSAITSPSQFTVDQKWRRFCGCHWSKRTN
jgi:hypothetical protein